MASGHFCIAGWRRTLAEAEERGYCTEEDIIKAAHWDQCAIGEAYTLYPHLIDCYNNSAGGPTDDILDEQGVRFYEGLRFAREFPLDRYELLPTLSQIPALRKAGFAQAYLALDRIERRLQVLEEQRS